MTEQNIGPHEEVRWAYKISVQVQEAGLVNDHFFPLFLQRQVAGEVQAPTHDRSVNQIAMMLAIMGLSLSYYSAKQMTEKVHDEPTPWRCANVHRIDGVRKRRSQTEDVQMSKIRTLPFYNL